MLLDLSNNSLVFFLLIGAIVVLLLWVARLEYRIHRLVAHGKGDNLEEAISHLSKKSLAHDEFRKEIETYLKSAEKRIKGSVQGVGIVRFNPFKSLGSGNQSFAIAFMNERGDGVVLSSLYSREHVGIYAKPVKNNLSEYELTDEEKQAINEALKSQRG